MVDSQLQTDMEDKISHDSTKVIKAFIKERAHNNTYYEICGFVGYDESEEKFVVTMEKNQSEDPKSFFSISPVSYLNFKNKYSMIGVYHTHILGDEKPSEFDIKMSESCCLPFIIYSVNTKKFHIYEPQNKEYNVNILERFKGIQ